LSPHGLRIHFGPSIQRLKENHFIKTINRHYFLSSVIFLLACCFIHVASGQTRTVRVVTYNIAADIDGATSPLPGLIAPPGNTSDVQAGGVLEGIGEEIVAGDPAQPLDILALEETTSNPQTIAPIVNGLNAFYAGQNVAVTYTNSPYQATESGGDVADGNGPNAMVYNRTTLQLLASVPIDPPGGTGKLGSSSGEYREVMRYEFAPAGIAATVTNEFYVYVSHYKSSASGSETTDESERAGEATIIRNNAATNLPAGSRIVFVGDYNITASGEASYQILLSNTAPCNVAEAQCIDPFNVTDNPNIDWGASTTVPSILAAETEKGSKLEYRDDLQLITTNVYYGTGSGLKLVPGTYHTFANNGTIPYKGTVNSGSNTSLSNLVTGATISASQLYLDATNASDHLPVVADYTIPVPAPVITGITLAGGNLVFNAGNTATNGVYVILTSTNLSAPPANWSGLATNTSGGGTFSFTLTNAVNANAPQAFYILQQQ
jgi:hypothetical protein